MITIKAPAKINLTLEVLRKRPDGYHEIRSVVQTISLQDTLSFTSSDHIEVRCTMLEWSKQKSLISKAIDLIKNASGYSGGVMLAIEKHIPLMAGLGGDSSDAATVLKGLNELWQLDLSLEKLTGFAQQLGSDVSFFLTGGTALMEGRGEKVTPLPSLARHRVIIANPSVPHLPGKTGAAYASLRPSHFTDGQFTNRLVQELQNGVEFQPDRLFNVFENVVFVKMSEVTTYRDHVKKIGAPNVHLAGSGPALFTLLKDASDAEDLAVRFKNQKIETYLVETI